MGFRSYSADIKLLATKMSLDGDDLPIINASLRTRISAASLWRWKTLYLQTNKVCHDAQDYQPRGRPHLFTEQHLGVLSELVDGSPTIYLDELQKKMEQITGVSVSQTTLGRELHIRLGLSHLVSRGVHSAQCIHARTEYMMRVGNIPPEYFVFIDESGVVGRDSVRKKSWAKKGGQSYRQKLQTNQDHWTILPAVCERGMIAGTVVNGPVERVHVELFLARHLLPLMNRYPAVNSVLVLDNARIHHGGRIERLCDQAGVLLVYLPAYSPDLNPIENAFHSLKAQLRRDQAWYDQEDKAEYLLLLAGKVMTRSLMQSLISFSGYSTEAYWEAYNNDLEV